MAGGFRREPQRHGCGSGTKGEAKSLRLAVHIVGGGSDDWIFGDASCIPTKAEQESEPGDPITRPTRLVDFSGNGHDKNLNF